MPIIGLAGLAVLLTELRTSLMLLGLATNAVGIVVTVREVRRVTSDHRLVKRRSAVEALRVTPHHPIP